MRISDWSSDVCSSDQPNVWSVEDVMSRAARPGKRVLLLDDTGTWRGVGTAWHLAEQGHEVDRKCVVEGKSVSVRVDLGGRRFIKKKTQVLYLSAFPWLLPDTFS